ncbi:MAG TPA: ATP-binding protein [Planctomycetota bacterium]|nr:ATP-binding protein [Planctomycetota bacterium]
MRRPFPRPARFSRALLALVLAAPASAQQVPIEARIEEGWRWRQLPSPDLRAPSFRTVRPWKDGLIATDESGLAYYDGYRWTRQPGWERRALGDVFDIVPAGDGVIVVCDGYILAVDGEGQEHRLDSLPRPRRLQPAFRRPDGTSLIAVGERILELSDAGEDVRAVRTLPPGASTFHSVAVDAAGAIWVTTNVGLFRETAAGWVHEYATPAGRPRPLQLVRIIPARDRLYFMPESLDDPAVPRVWDGERLLPLAAAASPTTITDAASCPRGSLILALDAPFLRVIRDGIGRDSLPALPSRDKVRSVCHTGDGRLALVCGTGELWIADLGAARWAHHDTVAAGVGHSVNALAPSARGGVWVATHLGLARFHNGAYTDAWTVAGETGETLRGLTTVLEDEQGRVWVGSGAAFGGALRLDGERWTRLDGPSDVSSRFVHAIRRIGSALWFLELDDYDGRFGDGQVVRLEGGVYTRFDRDAEERKLPRCYDLVARPDGTLVLGTAGGLFTFDGTAWQPKPLPELRADRAFALHVDRQGTLWIGLGIYHEGVIAVRDGRATRYGESDWGRAAAADICETDDGRLWFASENGLFLVVGDECHEVTAGLPARNFWPLLPSEDGGLWVGSMVSGLVHFRPDDPEPPETLGVEISFSEENDDVIATWTASDRWDTTPTEELRFRLAIDGRPVDTAATWSGTRQLHEADLGEMDGGGYTLTVEAVDVFGNVERTPFEKGFKVPKPDWRILVMLAALGALAVTLVAVLANRRRERLAAQRRQAELAERLSVLTRRLFTSSEDERRRLSRELHDDLGQALTSIGLDLQIAERKGQTESGRIATARALDTVRSAIDRVRAISSLLRPAVLDDLGLEQAARTALTEFTTRTGVDAQLQVELEGARVPDSVAGHVYRILQEALTNVARHASASTAFVDLRATPERIELAVRDDGRGFSLPDTPTAKRFGLLGMRERSELMGGSFTLESAPGSGTTIHVSIPLKPAPEPV